MRCAVIGAHDTWVEVRKPDIVVTRSDFDTITQVYEKVKTEDEVTAFPVGGETTGFDRMYVTSSTISERTPGVWTATVTSTGIYQSDEQPVLYQWLSQSLVRPRQLFKPVEVSMRSYADEIAERDQFSTNYILRIPRLTVTEQYVTDERPDNTEIGKSGQPLQPPGDVDLPSRPNTSAFDEVAVSPNGWILNTRTWRQVLDKPIYSVLDEWAYQTATEYVNIPPAE